MIDAAKQTTPVFPLAALRQFAGNSHQGHRTASTTFRPGAVLAISNTVTAIPASCYDSASSFTVVGNNPLSDTDPSGMDAEGGGCPICDFFVLIGIGIADAFGLGSHHTPSLADFPFPNQFPSAGPSGGPLGPGNGNNRGPFGSGNTGPYVFSFQGSQSISVLDLPGQWFAGFVDLFLNNKPSGGARMVYAVGAELAAGAVVGKVASAVGVRLAARALNQYVDVSNLSTKILRQMASRGWTVDDILDTVQNGRQFPVLNKGTGANAIEYVNPRNGRFVVVDGTTKQVIQVSGPGFLPNHLIK